MIEKLYSIYTIKIKYHQSLNNFCVSFDKSRKNFNRSWLQYLHFAKLVGKNKLT